MKPSNNERLNRKLNQKSAFLVVGVSILILFISTMLGFTYYGPSKGGGASCAICQNIVDTGYAYTGYGFPFNYYTENGYIETPEDRLVQLPLEIRMLSPMDVLQKLENDSDINNRNSYSAISPFYPSEDEHVEWQMIIYNILTWLVLYLATTRYVMPYIREQRLRKQTEVTKSTK